MKKETIFRHELNESVAANAAMSCLKNRNNPEQLNEALPLVAGVVRLAMPLLRPLITKLVKGLVMKAGAKLTGRQVAKAVIKNVSNGKTLMKIGKKVGQTWTEIPTELKSEIAKTAVDTWKEMRAKKSEPQIATQEQEEETSAFDERFAYRKDLRDMANDVTKKAYMIIRKEYGDSMWRQLGIDDCNERRLIDMLNDYQKYYNITNPQDIADCMLGRKSVRSFKKSREEQEEVKNYRDKLPGQYEEYVLPDIVDMVSDKGISEEEVIARLLATPELPWEYDEIEEWVAKNFAEEEEETTLSESELEDLTFKLADYLLESFIILEDEDEDYSNLLEAVEKILKKDAPKSNTVAGYYAWCRKWFMKIEDLTYSYYNEPNPESYHSDEDEENVYSDVLNKIINDGLGYWDVWEMAKQGKATKTELEISSVLLDLFETLMYNGDGQILSKVASGEIDKRELKRIIVDVLMEQDVDTFPKGESEYNSWVNEHNSEIVKRLEAKFNEEEEEDTLNAYYSQDEPDYENDHHGIWLIINLMRKKGMLRAKGIEGRDDVDDGHAINAAYDLIEQKLNDEGMWIGDDDHEAERFVSFFGEEIAEEAMKSAIHNQKVDDMEGSRKEYYSQDEPDYDDDSHGIRLILNMLMKRGDITKNDVPRVQNQIKSMLDAEGMWIGDDESEAERFIEMIWDNQEQEEMPQMERHDMILALSEYMSESWIATDDGDLDDIYYAIADILDETGDYPQSTDWKDCKPWCQKYYQEVEARIQ